MGENERRAIQLFVEGQMEESEEQILLDWDWERNASRRYCLMEC
jgi:hypothetical protein